MAMQRLARSHRMMIGEKRKAIFSVPTRWVKNSTITTAMDMPTIAPAWFEWKGKCGPWDGLKIEAGEVCAQALGKGEECGPVSAHLLG